MDKYDCYIENKGLKMVLDAIKCSILPKMVYASQMTVGFACKYMYIVLPANAGSNFELAFMLSRDPPYSDLTRKVKLGSSCKIRLIIVFVYPCLPSSG